MVIASLLLYLLYVLDWISQLLSGFPRSWKVLDFFGYNFQVLESPGKCVWSWKVLEI